MWDLTCTRGVGLWAAVVGAIGSLSVAIVLLPRLFSVQIVPWAAPLVIEWFIGFCIAYGLGWLALGAIAALAETFQPTRVQRQAAALFILFVALLLRVATIVMTPPQFSDDLFRYIHDGAMLADQGVSPYRDAPEEVVVRQPINHPHLVTIYQPASQWLFATLAAMSQSLHALTDTLAPSPIPPTLTHRVFRFGFLVFDLLIMVLLILKLSWDKRSVWWAVLWAWHPLVIIEVAGSGHQDVMGIAWLLITLMLIDPRGAVRDDRWPKRRAFLAGVAFGLAFGVKPIVGPLAVVMVWSLRRRPGMLVVAIAAAVLTLLGLYLPFALMEGGLGRMCQTAMIFADTWSFNSSAHGLLAAVCGQRSASLAMGVALSVILVLCMLYAQDLWQTVGIYFLAAILLSSTSHPWYLLWALVLVPLRFSPATWLFSLTIVWSYVALIDREAYRVPQWLKYVEYVPVYLAVAWQLGQRSGLDKTLFRSFRERSG